MRRKEQAGCEGRAIEYLPRFQISSLSLIICATARRNVKTRGGDLQAFRIYSARELKILGHRISRASLYIVWPSDFSLWIFANIYFLLLQVILILYIISVIFSMTSTIP